MKVSVIIPSYNHARYLSRCIESVLAQTYDHLEIVLVDDCSSDDSWETARSFSDIRVRIHRNEQNLGTYATQNRGLDLATGDLIAILNSDDSWHPTKLEKQVQSLHENPAAVFSYTRGEAVRDSGSRMDHHGEYPVEPVQELFPHLLHENRVLASSVVFRKGLVRFREDLRFSGDWMALVDLSGKGKATFVNEMLTSWRLHEQNTSSRLDALAAEEIRVRQSLLATFARRKLDPVAQKNLAQCAVSLNALLILCGDQKAARIAAEQALQLDPDNRTAQKRLKHRRMPLWLQRRFLWPGANAAKAAETYRNADHGLLAFHF